MVKKLCWHTTFDDIEVNEPQSREGARRRRPFAQSAQVSHRGCSLPLQRVVTDLGADLPFAQAAGKLHEHYGVTLSPSTIRQVTEGHARALLADGDDDEPAWPTQTGAAIVLQLRKDWPCCGALRLAVRYAAPIQTDATMRMTHGSGTR